MSVALSSARRMSSFFCLASGGMVCRFDVGKEVVHIWFELKADCNSVLQKVMTGEVDDLEMLCHEGDRAACDDADEGVKTSYHAVDPEYIAICEDGVTLVVRQWWPCVFHTHTLERVPVPVNERVANR